MSFSTSPTLVNEYSSLRTCVEKSLMSTSKIRSGLRAAFLKKNIWPENTKTLKIQILEPADRVQWTPFKQMENAKDITGKQIIPDPLENKARSLRDIKSVIELVVKERLQPIIGISFEFTDTHGDIRIGFNPEEGAYSLVGTDSVLSDAPTKTMNLGWLDVGTIIHEFCHALGMIHEHQNPKGKTIAWNEKEVYKWAGATQGWDNETTYTNIIKRYSVDQINGSDFDSKSIMLYFFPGSLTIDGKGTNMNCWLSPTDVIWLSQIYPGGRMSPVEFYKYSYDTSITSQKSLITMIKTNLKYSIPIIVIIVLIIVVLFYFIYKSTFGKQPPLLPQQPPLVPQQAPLLQQPPLLPQQAPLLPHQSPLLPQQAPLLPQQAPPLHQMEFQIGNQIINRQLAFQDDEQKIIKKATSTPTPMLKQNPKHVFHKPNPKPVIETNDDFGIILGTGKEELPYGRET